MNKEIPGDLIERLKVEMKDFSSECLPEKGHDSWWDRCFINDPPSLPRYHYSFGLAEYSEGLVDYWVGRDPNWFTGLLKRWRINKEFIRALINRGEEPLYIRLYDNHIITEEDLENVIEFNLDDYDFREGYAPKELRFEINKFYRLKVN